MGEGRGEGWDYLLWAAGEDTHAPFISSPLGYGKEEKAQLHFTVYSLFSPEKLAARNAPIHAEETGGADSFVAMR